MASFRGYPHRSVKHLDYRISVMESTEAPSSNTPGNSNPLITVQPAKKLGGRGTPRRKTRRSITSPQTALAAARTLENKLKPFRAQFQLYDQQELCDVTILYEDGRIEVQNQVHVHSTYPMTLHQTDPSEAGTQSYHLDELDADSCCHLLGQHFSPLPNPPQPTSTIASTYYQNLQPAYTPSSSSHSYLNYLAYQQNSYPQENYSDTIRQVYGSVKEEPNGEEEDQLLVPGKSKRRRRRRKPTKAPAEPVEEKPAIVEEVKEQVENEDSPNAHKRKRKRVRKSKRSTITGDQPPLQSDLISEQSEKSSLPSSLNEENKAPSLDLNEPPSSSVEFSKKEQNDLPRTDGLQTISSDNNLSGVADENKETPRSSEENAVGTGIATQPSIAGVEKIQRPHATERIVRRTSRSNILPSIVIEEDLSKEMDEIENTQPPSSSTSPPDSNQKTEIPSADSKKKRPMSTDQRTSEATSGVNTAAGSSLDQASEDIDPSLKERGKHLNPDAPDFSPTSRQEFTGISTQRRSTIADHYNPRQDRIRYHSETQQLSENSSPIIPLLSLMPEYNQLGRPEDSRRRSKTISSSSQSRAAQLSASPLMEQPLMIDENFYPNITSAHRYGSQRPRAATGRSLAVPSDLDSNRKRAHSGPETLVQPSEPVEVRLSGIHSLTRIMVGILRMIHPVSTSGESQSISTSTPSIQSKYSRPSGSSSQGRLQPLQHGNESLDVIPATEDPTVDVSSVEQAADTSAERTDSFAGQNEPTLVERVMSTDLGNSEERSKTVAKTDPESSRDAEKFGNRTPHLVKIAQDEEQQNENQTNSSVSSSSSGPNSLAEERKYSPPIPKNDNGNSLSSMNTSASYIDDDDDGKMRKKQSEGEKQPTGQENWVRNDERMCTTSAQTGKGDKESGAIFFARANRHNPDDQTTNNHQHDESNNNRDMNTNDDFSLLTSTHINAKHALEQNDGHFSNENNLPITAPTSRENENKYLPSALSLIVNNTTSMSAASSGITIPNNNNNHQNDEDSNNRDEQYVEATPSGDERAVKTTANVDDCGENRRDREKGEREKREEDNKKKRTPTPLSTREEEKTEERERATQANKTTDSVTSFTSEQHSCPSVVRHSVDDSMAHRVSSSSFNKTNQTPNTSSSNTRSSRSTLTTHTYASTNTFNTEPTYTSAPISGDPRTLHSYYVASSNYRPPPTSPATSLTRRFHEHEPSYPSISRYRTPSSSSPYRKTHYLDDSDEEIINEEILEITDLNHYPTLMERWGDDTKTVVRQEGELKIEDFVEFEETEPTVIEEILYELVYSGDKLRTCRQIHRSRSESRNFRKIKKRRTKRKRQPNDESSYLTSQDSSRDNSGTRSPFTSEQLYNPERSRTPTQSPLSSSWQSTGFLSPDKASLDISIRNRSDDQNYVNRIRVNESDPFLPHASTAAYPSASRTNNVPYRTLQSDSLDRRSTNLLDEMRVLSEQINELVENDERINDLNANRSSIREERGITRIDLTSTDDDRRAETLGRQSKSDATHDTSRTDVYDRFSTPSRRADHQEQSPRTNIIDQTSVQKELIREATHSPDTDEQISSQLRTKYEESERDEEDHSSTTEPTIQESWKNQQKPSERDTDDDASFSDSEQISSKPLQSDDQTQAKPLDEHQSIEQAPPSSLISTSETTPDHEIRSRTTESSINSVDDSRQKQPTPQAETQLQSTMEQAPITRETTEINQKVPDQDESQPRTIATPVDEQDHSSSETSDSDLRSFLNSLTAHLMPELPTTFDDHSESTEDDQSLALEAKSTSDQQRVPGSLVQRSIDDAQDEWSLSSQPSLRSFEQTTQPTVDEQHLDSDNEGKPSSWFGNITSALSSGIERIQENLLGKHETPSTSDHSTAELANQELGKDKQTNFTEKETNSQAKPSIADETFSSVRQSKQLGEEERTADVDSAVDNNNQISGRSTSSPMYEEGEPVQNTKSLSRSSIDMENKLSSATTSAETPQSIITSQKQIKAEDISEDKEEQVSGASSSTTETITSIDQQSSSDSLIDIVRQIGIRPHIADLSSRSSKTDVTTLSQETSVTAEQTHENIPQDQDVPLQSISTLATPVTHTPKSEDDQKRSEATLVIEHENAPKESSEPTSTANVQRNETESSAQVEERTVNALVNESILAATQSMEEPSPVEKRTDDVPTVTETAILEDQQLPSSSRHETWATEIELERPPSREKVEGESTIRNLTSIVRQVPLLLTTDVEQLQESFQSTDTTEDQTSSTRSAALPLQSSQQEGVPVTTDHPPSTDLPTKEELSEISIHDRGDPHAETGKTKKTVVDERSATTAKEEETHPDITTDQASTLLRQSSIEDASRDQPRLQSSSSSITPVDSINSLTETVRQILATPVSIHLPSVDHSQITTTEASSQPLTIIDVSDDASPVLSSRSFITEITEETTADDAQTEAEAERLAMEALSEAVRTLAATPAAPIDSSWEELSSAPDAALQQSPFHVEKQEEKKAEIIDLPTTTASVAEHTETVETHPQQTDLVPSKSTITDNSTDQTHTEETTPVKEEIKISEDYQSANEQKMIEEESERLASNALKEAVQEIIHRPAPSVESDNQEPVIDSLVGIMREVKTVEPRSKSLLQEVQKSFDVVSTVPAVDADLVSSSQVFSSEVPTTTDSRLHAEDKSSIEDVPEGIPSEVQSVSTESTLQSAPAVKVPAETIDQINTKSIPDVSVLHTESVTTADAVKSAETKQQSTDEPVDSDQRVKIVTTTTTTEETTHSLGSADKEPSETAKLIPDSTAVTSEPSQRIETSTEQITSHQSPQEEVSTFRRDEEAQADRLTSEVFKQVLEEISATPSTDPAPSHETSTPHNEITADQASTLLRQSSIEDASRDQPRLQSSSSSITPVDSINSLTETVRQILATPVSIHLPSVDHSQTITTEASSQPLTITDVSDDASPVLSSRSFITEITEEPSAVANTQDQSSATHQPETQSQEVQHISGRTTLIETDTSDKSESPSAESSSHSAHQITEDDAKKIESTVETTTKEPPVIIKVTSPEDDKVPLQSPTKETDPSDTADAAVPTQRSDPDSENESLSSSTYEKIDNVVSGAIVDACVLLDQGGTETEEKQSLSSTSSMDASLERVGTDTSSVSDSERVVDDVRFSTAGLVNIVHEIRNLPNRISSDTSLPREDNKIIISSKSDIHEQVNIDELTNIVDSITKTVNSQRATTDQPSSTNEVALQRASAVAPKLVVDTPPEESPEDHVAKFFVPGTPTPSENDFRDIYERRYFVSSSDDDHDYDERLSSSFVLSKNEDLVLREEGDLIPDSPMAYYELQQERHTLMSPQQSVGEENQADTTSPSLTTWTTIQPLIDFDQSEEKRQSIDLNLNDQAYQYARQIDLESSAAISNLPTGEYRQVFGVSDEIVDAVDDMTEQVDRTLSAEKQSDEETSLSDGLKSQTSGSDDTSLGQQVPSPLVVKEHTTVASSVQRITDALNSLESDLLQQEELALESSGPVDHPEQQQTKDEAVTETVPTQELDARYSALFERLDFLERSLTASQSSASSTTDDDLIVQTTAPADETSVKDTFTIDGLLGTMQQILATPFRTVTGPYEKLASTESNEESGLTTALEQILASTQYRTPETKLAGPVDTLQTTDQSKTQTEEVAVSESHTDDVQSTQEGKASIKETTSDTISSVKESVQHFLETVQPSTEQKEADEQINPVSGMFTSRDVYHAYKQPVEPTLAEPEHTSLTDQLSSTFNNVVSAITTALPTASSIDTATSHQRELGSKDIKENLLLSRSTEGVEQNEEAYPGSTGLYQIMKSLLPFGLSSKSASVDEQPQPDQVSKIVETTTTTTFHEVHDGLQPTLETSPVSSSRLTTEEFVDAPEPTTEAAAESKASFTLLEKAQSIVDQVMSSVATALPVSRSDETDTESHETIVEATTPAVQSATTEETLSSSAVTLPQIIDSVPLDNLETHDTVNSYELPTLSTRQVEVAEVHEQMIGTEGTKRETPISATALTEEPTSILKSSVQPQQQEDDAPYTGSGYFLSRDVYHGYKQPVELSVEHEGSPSLTDRASSFATGLISSITSHLPSSTKTESDPTLKSTTTTFEEEPLLSESSTVVETHGEVKSEHEEHPASTGLYQIMQSLLPLRLRSKSATVDEQPQPDQVSKIVETTTTFHEVHDDLQPTLETSPVSSSRLVTEEFVDAPESTKEAATESKDSSTLLEKAQSVVDQVMLSVATVLPVSRSHEKDTESHETIVEATTPAVQSATSEETLSSSAVTLPTSIDSVPRDNLETHDAVKSYELPTLQTRQAEVTKFDNQTIGTEESKRETSVSATTPTEVMTNISESSVQPQQEEDDAPYTASGYFLSRDVYHGYKQPVELSVEHEGSPSLSDRASSFVTGLISSVTSHLPSSARRASSSGEHSVATSSDNEPILSHPSAEVKSEQEVEHPTTSGLLENMKSFTPLGRRSDSSTAEEEQRSDESAKFIATTTTTTFHELKTSPVSSDQLTAEEFVDVQDFPTEQANVNSVFSSLKEKATSIVDKIMLSVATALPGSKLDETDTEPQKTTVEVTTPTVQSAITEETVSSSACLAPETIYSEPLDNLEIHDAAKSHDSPTLSTRQAEVTEFDDEKIRTEESKRETSVSATAPTVEPTNILKSSVQPQQQEEDVSNTGPGYFLSRDVYHEYKQPVEPTVEHEGSASLSDRASSFVSGLISSVTSHLPSSARRASSSGEHSVATTFDEEPLLSQPSTVAETHDEVKSEHEEHPASTGLYQIMQSLLPLRLRSKSATVDEQPQPDQVSKIVETTTTTTFHEVHDDLQPTLEKSPVSSSWLTSEEFADALEPTLEVAAESKGSSTLLEKATSIVDRVMSSVATVLPTSKNEGEVSASSLADTRETTGSTKDEPIHADDTALTTATTTSKSPEDLHMDSDVVEEQKESDTESSGGLLKMMESFPPSQLLSGTSTHTVSSEPSPHTAEEHGLLDQVAQAFSDAKESITNLVTSTQPSSTVVSHEDSQQVELSEEKQTLLKAAQEILAVPLQAATETYEKIVSGQDESSSRVEEEEPALKASLLPEVSEPQNESDDKPSHQQLQMIDDDYSRYSTHYSIADAEAKIDLLYRNLSLAIEQLDQQPPVTSVEFQPEPHPQLATPEYDREALADTQDTREKVHELAQYSSAIVTTTSSSPDGDEKDEDGFQVVQRRKRIPSSTVYEKTSSSTTSKSNLSPDIDLEPVVLRGRADVAVPLATAGPTTAKAATSTKKKNKTHKKDKDEEILFDAPVPPSMMASEQKPKVELPKETSDSDLLASAVTIESSDIDQTSEANKEVQPTVHVVEQLLESSVFVEQPEEESQEFVSASAVSNIEELKNVDDENNDSTSSDASQLLSSFTNVPDDDKTRQENIEQPVVIESITTTTTITHEQPELSATSIVITEPESEEPSLSSSSLSSAAAENAQAQPKPAVVPAVKTSQKTASSKKVTPLEEEIDDDDGFQVVSYSKSSPPVAQKKKTSSVSSKASLEGTSSPDLESKSVTSSERQDTSTSPSSATVPKATARKKKDKKPKQDTPSADSVIISSPPAESVSQPTKEEKTSATSQLSSSPLVDQPSVATRAVLPPTGKPPSATIRVKASTSPEEEGEEDDEGFQVVHYGKRIPSASRTGKTASPSPSKAGYQQKYGRNTDFKPRGGQGRPGSESRLIPRRAPGDQRPPNRSQQNQSEIPPFGAPRSTVTSTRQMSSSPNLERRPVEFSKPPLPDNRPQTSDSQLQSSFIDQTWRQVAPSSVTTFEQQPIISGERQTTAASRPSLSDQHEQQQKSERRAEQFSTIVSTFTPAAPQQASPPVKVETKPVLPPAPVREVAPPTLSSSSPAAPRKTEEEDDDGFRVVRYRKNLPLSATGSPTMSKHDSVSSDSEKKQTSSPKKVSPPALPKAPVAPVVESVAPKTKPKKIKSTQEEILQSNILSSSTTDTDLHSASKEATVKGSTTETKTSSATVEKVQPPPVHQEVLSTQITEQSDEPVKKPKKKHKRAKQDFAVSGQSTPSDEATSFAEAAATAKSTISAPLPETPSVPEEKIDQIITKEETRTSVLTESTSAIDPEQGELPPAKKPTKRRKKKSQSTDKPENEASLMSSSTTSTTDKEISSTGSASIPSATTHDDQQEPEWRIAQGRNKKSKTSEPSSPSSPQILSFYPQSRLQPASPKIVPKKVTDVQFKFQKGGELTVTSPSSVERSPTEWGTIKFDADEQSPPSPAHDTPSTPLEEPIALPTIETHPVIETTTEIGSTASPVSEIRTESETTTTESKTTLTAGDLNAYRDPTGRLRRKKPRKHSNSKSESITSSVKDSKSAESEGDRRYVSDQWADVLVSPTSNTDEERQSRPLTTEHGQLNQSFEDEDTSESSSKLDMFLPDYIRQQMKTTPKTGTSPRSSSFTDDRSKSSSAEPSMSFSPSRPAHVTLLSSSNRSTSSTDTSENESRRQSKKSIEQDDSKLVTPAEEAAAATTVDSPSTASTESARKRKQRQKMLKKDVEANTLLTREVDETPLASAEPSTSTPVTETNEDETKIDQGFLASIRQQFSSVISTISDSFTSALPSNEPAKDDEQSDAPVPSAEEPSSSVSTQGSSETLTTTTAKKSSTRSPRKRSKRDSGPDYDSVSLPSTDETEQTLSTAPPADHELVESTKVETHKQQSRQRTASGRQMSSTEEDHEQRAVLADDEEDGSSASGATSKRSLQKKKSASEERELSAPAPDEPKVDPQETSADQSASNEQLRPVQGFHSFTPNLYQYNQYEEGPTVPSDPVVTTSTEPSDTVLSRGFNLWLQKGNEIKEPSPAPTKEPSSSVASGLTRAMQSLIIQPMESDDDDEEEEDSWNGPRARKPTYTTGIRTEKRIHSTSAYNINHPRSTSGPSWLIAPSTSASHPDDPSRFDPDEEEDSIDDSSEKQILAPSVATQLSTVEERQTHLKNLAELTFQPTIPTQSSSSKWNEASMRSEDPSQQQTSFTEDDVQRCLGEDFFRESPTSDPLANEQRTLTSLEGLVLKPLQLSDDTHHRDDDDDEHSDDEPHINRNSNNNNNHRALNFDEWAHFLERQHQHQMSLSSLADSASLEPPISYECSYARALNEDTFVSDLLPIDPATSTEVEYITETEAQRYGDFSSLHEHAPLPEATVNRPLQLSNREQEFYSQPKPSETFHRWRNQSSLERQQSNMTSAATEQSTDDEIFVSHSDGGLSRRVKPPT